MKQKPSLIVGLSLMAFAVVMVLFLQKKEDAPPAESPNQTNHTRISQRQEAGLTPHSPRERKEIDDMAQLERKKMTALWIENASASFALTKNFLIVDLSLSAQEVAELDQIFSRRESQLAGLLNGEAADDIESIRKICAILRNKGLREDLAGMLTPEKLAAFDANEATRERETIEARAYRDMAEINDLVSLTDSQKQQALAALLKSAPAHVEQEADTRAFLTLHYGQMLTDADSSAIRGMANMLDAALKYEMPADPYGSQPYQQWTQDKKTQRINSSLSALENTLDEEQLTRYRDYLETEPAW